MTQYPSPIDFNQAWHACTAQDKTHRGDAAIDLAFWQTHAAGYDTHSRSPGYFENTLAAIESLVMPTDTVLDVGAGTGRFAIPLARQVHQVTALDHAEPMLAILKERAIQAEIHNIRCVKVAWEDATIEPHDVVLAAWSLYRQPDLLASMQALITATRRTLIIVAGVGNSIRHEPLLQRFWPQEDSNNTPMHIYFHGILWQAGLHADLKIVYEHHRLEGATPQSIVEQMAPDGAHPGDIEACATLLAPQLLATETGWLYRRPVPVGLLVWQNRSIFEQQN